MEKELTTEQVGQLQIQSLSISRENSWRDDAPWIATAYLRAKTGSARELKIELDDKISTEIMRLLAPHIVKSASNAAQQLADDAKKMAEALGNCMIKSIEENVL